MGPRRGARYEHGRSADPGSSKPGSGGNGHDMTSYEDACARHEWRVPDRYNIAADVCEKHPPGKPAMVHEDPEGQVRELSWGELQDLSSRFASVLRQHG